MQLQNKKDLKQNFLKYIEDLKPFYSEGCALVKLDSFISCREEQANYLEGFARPLWGMVPFWLGATEEDKTEVCNQKEIIKKGLVNGTNPQSKEYWGHCKNYDQRFVEMMPIAYMLLTNPDIEESMSEEEKDNLYNWLAEYNHNKNMANNWVFFHIFVNMVLKRAGRNWDEKGVAADFDIIETCYLTDGWYFDGIDTGKRIDYYIAFAWHYYSLLYVFLFEQEDPERCKIYRERAIKFGKEFIYYFDDKGSAIPYGRSMIYRFAQVSFYSMCVLTDTLPFSLGELKGIIFRHLRWWHQYPITNNDGILTLGYCYSNLIMTEDYNGPGSPYWAMKVYALLALPQEHQFWAEKELPMPALEKTYYIKTNNSIIQRVAADNTVLLNGSAVRNKFINGNSKYCKFAYSSKYGFNVTRDYSMIYNYAMDSSLIFKCEIPFTYFLMHSIIHEQSYDKETNSIIRHWKTVGPVQLDIETIITPTETGHIRTHKFFSLFPLKCYDTSFAYPCEEDILNKVKILEGKGEIINFDCAPGTNLISPKVAIPAAAREIKKGHNIIKTEFIY